VTTPADSRTRILAAASAEFAARGFDDASVDDIARRARLNKAMIYYHFDGKRGLYLEILHDMMRALGTRTGAIAASDLAPHEKLAAFVDAFGVEADARPDLPFLMVREMADGARRLEADTLRLMTGIIGNLAAVLADGARAGVFRDVDPFMVYLSLIGPIVMFRVTAPARAALARQHLGPAADLDREAFVGHVKLGALAALNAGARLALPTVPPAPTRRPRRPSRSGVRP
jgi:AcrR family transcriptional regulator